MRRPLRKTALASILFAGAMLAVAVTAEAQQSTKMPRIGLMGGDSARSPQVDAFRQGLRELGYVEGKNILLEYRFVEGRPERFPEFAAELVGLKVDVIVVNGTGAALAAKEWTKTIPIVMTNVGDPVREGLIASLAHPGGNVTGLSTVTPELGGKQLELIKEAYPKVSRVAVLWDPTNPSNALWLTEAKIAAGSFRIALQPLEVRARSDLESHSRLLRESMPTPSQF